MTQVDFATRENSLFQRSNCRLSRLEQPDKILFNVPGRQKYGDPVLNISKIECRKRGSIFSMQKKHSAWRHLRITDEFHNILNIIVFIWSQNNKVKEVKKRFCKATVGRKCGDLLCKWKRNVAGAQISTS